MKHTWQLAEDGEPDTWAMEYGHHNGPLCTVCLEDFCMHCTPDWRELECEGEL